MSNFPQFSLICFRCFSRVFQENVTFIPWENLKSFNVINNIMRITTPTPSYGEGDRNHHIPQLKVYPKKLKQQKINLKVLSGQDWYRSIKKKIPTADEHDSISSIKIECQTCVDHFSFSSSKKKWKIKIDPRLNQIQISVIILD